MQNGNIWAGTMSLWSLCLDPWARLGSWRPRASGTQLLGSPGGYAKHVGLEPPVGATFQQKLGPRSGVGGSEPGWSRA